MCIANDCEYIESIKKYRKEYYKKNKDKLKEVNKQYYYDNKECVKERIIAYKDEHKEKIQTRSNTKYTCVCGGRFSYANKSKHLQSQKHIKFIEKQDVIVEKN